MGRKKSSNKAAQRNRLITSLALVGLGAFATAIYMAYSPADETLMARVYDPSAHNFLAPSSEFRKADLLADISGIGITRDEVGFAQMRSRGSLEDSATDDTNFILQSLARQKVLAQAAVEAGLHLNADFRAEVRAHYIELLAKRLLSQSLDPASLVTNKEIEAYMAENPLLFADRNHYAFDALDISVADFDQVDPAVLAGMSDHQTIAAYLDDKGIAYVRSPFALYAEQLPNEMLERMARFEDGQRAFFMRRNGVAQIVRVLGVQHMPQSSTQAFTQARLKLTEARRRAQLAKVEADVLDRLTGGAGVPLTIADQQ